MKKNFVFILIVVSIFIFVAVFAKIAYQNGWIPGMYDPNSGKRPYDYPSAKWVSESPDIWFVVEEINSFSNVLCGQLNIDGKIFEIEISFVPSVWVYFQDKNSSAQFDGRCKFNSEKLIVLVDKKTDTLFNGEYKNITFIRNPV